MKNTEHKGVRRRLAARALMSALVLALAGGRPASAGAQSAATGQPPVERSEVGHSTSAWLDLQRGNAQAATPQPMLGEEAGLAYARYMQSFRSRIPDLYGSALSQGSGGGQAAGMTGQAPQN
ncbi:DUF3613 domain-containing protein [Paraburkholderia dilworthii]|uniref:DUF3613 domain-containing protein n=1 Tax=Paraburkholderia dilworthii TaxID=948106 RepID=UPI00041F2AFF|nr:DUF3613 domain-containing protein [Paraburkholderia dilworthii]